MSERGEAVPSGAASASRNGIAALLGIAIVAGHVAAFAALAARSAGTDLEVELDAALASPTLALDGHVPDAIAARVATTVDANGPGLRRKRWSVAYRGGFQRTVGATQLVGPFQDPKQLACSGRVIVGQRLLDDGKAGRGTIAGVMKTMIDKQLRGMDVWPIGTYDHIAELGLRWARLETAFVDRDLIGPDGAAHGYMRVHATLVFSRVNVPVVLVLVPEPTLEGKLHFRAAVHADVTFDNRVANWLGDKLPLDRLATRIASQQLDDMLMTTIAPPPPFAIDDKQQLVFTYCKDPMDIVDGAWGALPFAVQITGMPNAPQILPPRFTAPPSRTPAADTIVAIDLDLDALNAMLYELWRTGWLDRQLGEVGLDRRFNTDPTVQEYLSVRLSPIRLALPPVIEPAGDHLRLAADARVTIGEDIRDPQRVTTGRIYGAVDFRMHAAKDGKLALDVDLGALELACERTATRLVPCYADLVATLADRGAEFHGALTDALDRILTAIFVERHLATGDLPAELTIHRATPTLAREARSLRLELDASLVETR